MYCTAEMGSAWPSGQDVGYSCRNLKATALLKSLELTGIVSSERMPKTARKIPKDEKVIRI